MEGVGGNDHGRALGYSLKAQARGALVCKLSQLPGLAQVFGTRWPMFNPNAVTTMPLLFVRKLITQRTAGARVGLSPTGRGARRPRRDKEEFAPSRF